MKHWKDHLVTAVAALVLVCAWVALCAGVAYMFGAFDAPAEANPRSCCCCK